LNEAHYRKMAEREVSQHHRSRIRIHMTTTNIKVKEKLNIIHVTEMNYSFLIDLFKSDFFFNFWNEF